MSMKTLEKQGFQRFFAVYAQKGMCFLCENIKVGCLYMFLHFPAFFARLMDCHFINQVLKLVLSFYIWRGINIEKI